MLLSLNQSIKSSICKAPLKQSSQRRLLWVGLHKEPSLTARVELFTTNITVLDMGWQHVPNLGSNDTETARTITRGPSTWYNHVIVVSRAKPGTKGNGDDRWTDVVEVHWWSATDTVVCHQRNFEHNVQRHGQPVKCVAQCWHDVVISPDACDYYITMHNTHYIAVSVSSTKRTSFLHINWNCQQRFSSYDSIRFTQVDNAKTDINFKEEFIWQKAKHLYLSEGIVALLLTWCWHRANVN